MPDDAKDPLTRLSNDFLAAIQNPAGLSADKLRNLLDQLRSLAAPFKITPVITNISPGEFYCVGKTIVVEFDTNGPQLVHTGQIVDGTGRVVGGPVLSVPPTTSVSITIPAGTPPGNYYVEVFCGSDPVCTIAIVVGECP